MRRLAYAVVAALLLSTAVVNSEASAADAGSVFTPLDPQRVLDTRNGTGTGGVVAPIGPGQAIVLDLSSRISTAATAVLLNVTGTEPTANTFVTVYPDGAARPLASNLNLVPGQTRPNAVTVPVGPGNKIDVYNNAGSTHLIADLAGFYEPDGYLFTPTAPGRVVDTRNIGGPLGPGGTMTVDFSIFTRPDATAVTFNLTGTGATAGTFLTAYRSDVERPTASSINLVPGETAPNLVTVPLGPDRTINLYNNAGSTHVIVDIAGYYGTEGQRFHQLSPQRIRDTRTDHSGPTPGVIGTLEVTSTGLVPPEATAIVANLTGTNPTAGTFVRVWPGNAPQPGNSNLNLEPGQTAANLITVILGTGPQGLGRAVSYINNNGYVDLIFDLAGYFAP